MDILNKLEIKDKLVALVQKENFVGWVYSVDYEKALVITNDIWKTKVHGIPHNSFLLATPFHPDKYSNAKEIDKQVILLRVTGSCKLPQDDDMIRMKIDNFQNQQDPFNDEGVKEYDVLTKNKIQFGGLVCRVIGTFYMKNNEFVLGSDIETFYMSTRLNVFMPKGDALKEIVNYVDPIRQKAAKQEFEKLGIQHDVLPFKIGTVRYTSTDRLNRRTPENFVPFHIQPSDFLARRTAVLGMTRTGKSNMIKQTVSVVKKISDDCNLKIGQLIYDINGEYANANNIDEGAISEIYKNDCTRYRSISKDGFKQLLNNFYKQLQDGHTIICDCIRQKSSSNAADLNLFMNSISFDEPNEVNEKKKFRQKIALYKTILFAAGFVAPKSYKIYFEANETIRNLVDTSVNPNDGLTLEESKNWFIKLRKIKEEIKEENDKISKSRKPEDYNRKFTDKHDNEINKWITEEIRILLNMLYLRNDAGGYFNGHKSITEAVKYHSFDRENDVRQEIYDLLCDGKIVILDLSVGNARIRDNVSKSISSYIFDKSMEMFTNGETPKNIVIYIEEAHNLIGKGSELIDTWPRLAKEGAKYKIALVYATQEVSSVHPNILANTENWFVSHLNSDREIRELAKFYDFEDFSQSLLRSQDVGFSRVKTLSSPFVIPIQIDKFEPKKIIEEQSLNVKKK